MPAVVMVRGPAAVRVKGRCHVLGMDISGRQVAVRVGKALPFEAGQDCALDIDGEAWSADPSAAGTAMWKSAVQTMLSRHDAVAVVIVTGEVDSGKSTFCAYLANVAISRGITPCVIDGDIGQGDLAPPAAMGAAAMYAPVTDLRDVKARFFEFIGSNSPAGNERLVAGRIRSLLGRTQNLAELHIINTDGYTDIPYKRMLARTLRPDAMVVLGSRRLATELKGPWQMIRAKSSWQATKTYPERVGHRLEQFMHYVGEGYVTIAVDRVKFVYSSRLAPGAMEGMFVGLGEKGRVKGFGIIEGIGEDITIKTSVLHFTTIWLSGVSLKGDVESRLF